MHLPGRVVLVTGASAGIGRATARRFAQEGALLALVARSADKLASLAEEIIARGGQAIAVPADLRDPDSPKGVVAQTVRHFGRLDILLNNAGQAAAGDVADVNPDHFRQITDLNVYAPLLLIQAAVPVMRKGGGGLIINVSSMVSKMRIPGLAAYAATKAALDVLSDTARLELAQDSIRVITIFPRMTATDFARNSLGDPVLRRRQREGSPAPVDSPEFVAEKIVAAALHEPDEQYMG